MSNILSKEEIESMYQSGLREIEKSKNSLEKWRADMLVALNVLDSQRAKESFGAIVLRPPQNGDKATPLNDTLSDKPGKFNQQETIRDIIDALSGDISLDTIRKEIKRQYPGSFKKVKDKSIQACVYKKVQAGEFEKIGDKGVMKIYRKATARLPELQANNRVSPDKPAGEGE